MLHPTHGSAAKKLTPDLLRPVANAFNKATGIGADGTMFKDIAVASDEPLHELCAIMRVVVQHLEISSSVALGASPSVLHSINYSSLS